MSDQVLGFVLFVTVVVGGICAIRGFFRFCIDIDEGVNNRRNKRRNAIPDTPIEKALRAAINLMVENPDNWRTYTGEIDYRGRAIEWITRDDGKITIRDYFDGGRVLVQIEGIGSFERGDIKPEIADKLGETCRTFKQLIAVHALLAPDKLLSLSK